MQGSCRDHLCNPSKSPISNSAEAEVSKSRTGAYRISSTCSPTHQDHRQASRSAVAYPTGARNPITSKSAMDTHRRGVRNQDWATPHSTLEVQRIISFLFRQDSKEWPHTLIKKYMYIYIYIYINKHLYIYIHIS